MTGRVVPFYTARMYQMIINPSRDQRRFGLILLLLALTVTSYLVFSQPSYSQSISHIDKVGHFGAFFALAVLLQWATNWRALPQLVILFLYALLIEAVQAQLPYRSAELADLAADMAGAGLFHLLLFGLRAWLKP